jgi:hypothetical protein
MNRTVVCLLHVSQCRICLQSPRQAPPFHNTVRAPFLLRATLPSFCHECLLVIVHHAETG